MEGGGGGGRGWFLCLRGRDSGNGFRYRTVVGYGVLAAVCLGFFFFFFGMVGGETDGFRVFGFWVRWVRVRQLVGPIPR